MLRMTITYRDRMRQRTVRVVHDDGTIISVKDLIQNVRETFELDNNEPVSITSVDEDGNIIKLEKDEHVLQAISRKELTLVVSFSCGGDGVSGGGLGQDGDSGGGLDGDRPRVVREL